MHYLPTVQETATINLLSAKKKQIQNDNRYVIHILKHSRFKSKIGSGKGTYTVNTLPICGSIIVRLASLQELANTTSNEIGLIYIAPGSGCIYRHLYLFSDPCI